MSVPPQSPVKREVDATARRYRRDGYKVSRPERSREKPSFLGDLVPDLIAERDDDKVVIEVKYASSVRGANDIVDLAERVAGQPGWRFELIALRSIDDQLRPDPSWTGEAVAGLTAHGFQKSAFIVAFAMIENLLGSVAQHAKIRTANMSLEDILKALVVNAVIDDETRDAVRAARTKRNAVMHESTEAVLTNADVESLLKLARRLDDDLLPGQASPEAA